MSAYFSLMQPVYVKDDFFDSLSSYSLDHGSENGRLNSSQQRKKDSEVHFFHSNSFLKSKQEKPIPYCHMFFVLFYQCNKHFIGP